jgi:ribosomal protein L20
MIHLANLLSHKWRRCLIFKCRKRKESKPAFKELFIHRHNRLIEANKLNGKEIYNYLHQKDGVESYFAESEL